MNVTPKISVVIPAYNEAESIINTIQELIVILGPLTKDNYEVLVIDDHSSDNTLGIIRKLKNPTINCVRLSRNLGSHVALRAGLSLVKGDGVLCMSADGQDDPACLESIIEKWKKGIQVIWALRKDRISEPWFIRKTSEAFYKILFWLLSIKDSRIDLSRASFFFLDRIVVEAIDSCLERNTSLFGLIAWIGFKQDYIEYNRRERFAGKSKWGFRSKYRLAKDWIIAFSGLPLRLTSWLGVFISMLGILYAVYVVIVKLLYNNIAPGWASIIVAILIMGGLQLTILGVVGEYLWRNLDESRRRPLYFIESTT